MATALIFNVEVRSSPRHAQASIVDVEGEVDVLTAPRFRAALAKIVDSRAATVVVNLDRVRYMDSTGLGVLVSAMKQIRENQGTIALTGLNPHLGKIFEISGLRKVFKIYASEGEALCAGQ